jgi:hypothetical protein
LSNITIQLIWVSGHGDIGSSEATDRLAKLGYECPANLNVFGRLGLCSDGCETWFLTLREEHKLRVFENRVLRRFGPKRDEVTVE